jgi:long-chain acyl-CoA synthetase
MRYISDLRDMVHSSAEMFADKTAFKEKEDPKGEFKSISYKQFKEDIE